MISISLSVTHAARAPRLLRSGCRDELLGTDALIRSAGFARTRLTDGSMGPHVATWLRSWLGRAGIHNIYHVHALRLVHSVRHSEYQIPGISDGIILNRV